MKISLQTTFDIIRTKMPNVAILPTIGNNDVVIHNNVPCDDSFAL
jgi:hypothetical protein